MRNSIPRVANPASQTLAFRVEVSSDKPVWGFSSRTDSSGVRTVFAGTGSDGIVLESTDLETWTTFMTVADCHARSVFVWAEGLFVGTQPLGRIYVHNFATGSEYLFVETEDSSVTSFASYNGYLFAGTAPTGIVYSFDGVNWKEEYRPYGGGVTSMVSSSNGLFVFSSKSEGPVVFDGVSWKTYPSSSGVNQTAASNRVASRGFFQSTGLSALEPSEAFATGINAWSTSDIQMVTPTIPQFNTEAAALVASKIVFGGMDNGVVLSINPSLVEQKITKFADFGCPISSLVYIEGDTLMAASPSTVFLTVAT